MITLRTLLLSLVVMVVLSVLPMSSHATTFWDDELESGNTGYDFSALMNSTCGGVTWGAYDTVNKVSGTASLKENFPGPNLCGGFADRYFPNTTDLWSRFYVRLSPGFVVDGTGTKLMNNSTDKILSNWWVMMFGRPDLVIAVQNYPAGNTTNLYPNTGNGSLRTNPEGQFLCIETRTKLNDVGQANGVIEAYKNGVQIMNHTGLEMRTVSQGSQNSTFIFNRMYRQHGTGSINYDRLAFGNTRIGCLGSAPPSEIQPPSGLKVIP